MTEFTGLDLEMAIEEHYHEVLELLDGLFLHMFRSLRQKYSGEIETVRRQFPAEEFKWREGPEGTLKLSFREAVDLLVEDGVPREVLDDIKWVIAVAFHIIVNNSSDIAQKMRSGLVELFGLSMIPTISSSTSSLWSFGPSTQCRTRKILYISILSLNNLMTDNHPLIQTLSNSYDFFMRGEEILSGAQRIHDPELLAEKMRTKGVDPGSMNSYLDAFKMGCPPHGGGGIGLERVLMLFLKLNNIRRASLFPRDPKRLEP